jgi:hypothetical protein
MMRIYFYAWNDVSRIVTYYALEIDAMQAQAAHPPDKQHKNEIFSARINGSEALLAKQTLYIN